VGYYSVIKKNDITSFAGIWMELEVIMLSKTSQALERQISHFLSYAELRLSFSGRHESRSGTIWAGGTSERKERDKTR
jgi:hypothetical protein